ncbi:MAG TPA: hypothetical protein VLG27_04660 [Candidatus Saccharimonadia bacterium]|nr:hypothetical protein [Candidatus Saccharimonadia bacterium]
MSETHEGLNAAPVPPEERLVYNAALPLLRQMNNDNAQIKGLLPADNTTFPNTAYGITRESGEVLVDGSFFRQFTFDIEGYFEGELYASASRGDKKHFRLAVRDGDALRPATEDEIFRLGSLLFYLNEKIPNDQAKPGLRQRLAAKLGRASTGRQ